MSKVIRLGYVHLRVTDLEESRNHYSNTLGMEVVATEPGKLYLKCWDEWDHHSLVLEEGGVGLVKLGYKVENPDAMTEFEQRAQQFGVTTGRFSAVENLTVGEGVRITLPSEHNIELYTEMEYAGTETGAINPEAWPRNVRGVGTHWIDHALMPCEDPGLNERFLSEVLDFKTAERVVTSMEEPEVIGTWMSCGESPHDIAFIKGPNGKLHHFAYHLEDWSAILKAGDIFAMDDVPIDIGPTRHGITRGTTTYFFDPSGNRNEVFAGLGYAEGLPDHQLDRRPARHGHLLPRTGTERRLHQRLHLIDPGGTVRADDTALRVTSSALTRRASGRQRRIRSSMPSLAWICATCDLTAPMPMNSSAATCRSPKPCRSSR